MAGLDPADLPPPATSSPADSREQVAAGLPDRPARSASKADWVAYRTALGVPGADAEAMGRDELADLDEQA